MVGAFIVATGCIFPSLHLYLSFWPMYYPCRYPLPVVALCDRSEFSWLRELEDAAPDITREMEALAKARGGRSYRGGTGEMSTVYDATKGWGTMRIRYMGRCAESSGGKRVLISHKEIYSSPSLIECVIVV